MRPFSMSSRFMVGKHIRMVRYTVLGSNYTWEFCQSISICYLISSCSDQLCQRKRAKNPYSVVANLIKVQKDHSTRNLQAIPIKYKRWVFTPKAFEVCTLKQEMKKDERNLIKIVLKTLVAFLLSKLLGWVPLLFHMHQNSHKKMQPCTERKENSALIQSGAVHPPGWAHRDLHLYSKLGVLHMLG